MRGEVTRSSTVKLWQEKTPNLNLVLLLRQKGGERAEIFNTTSVTKRLPETHSGLVRRNSLGGARAVNMAIRRGNDKDVVSFVVVEMSTDRILI